MLSTDEMCGRARVTYRQLDYWIRCGVLDADISAAGTGSSRRFGEDQVRVVRLLGDLASLGAGTTVLKRTAAWATLLPFED